MNQEPKYIKCDEASINRITNLVDAHINEHIKPNVSPKRPIHQFKKGLLVASISLLSLSSLAFAANIDLPAVLKAAYDQLFPNETMATTALNHMQPLEGSSIFNGIEAKMLGYICDNDVLYLTFSLRDLEGDRIDETTFIYDYELTGYNTDYIAPYGDNRVFGSSGGVNILYTSPLKMEEITLVDYDEATKTAIFNYRFSNHSDITFSPNGIREFFKKLELRLNLIASGGREGEASLDLSKVPIETFYESATIEADFDDFKRDGYYGVSKELQTFLLPDEMEGTLLNVPGVVLSNIGIIDDRLHVLIKYKYPRDICINRVLDMTLKSSQKTWDANSEVYLKDGEYTGTVCRFRANNAYYAEYIFDLPANYTSSDLQLLYHYRTYDYITGMTSEMFVNLPEEDEANALWKLRFSPKVLLEEKAIPFKLEDSKHKSLKECTAYISPLGLMIPEPPDYYCNLYYEKTNHTIYLMLTLNDGSQKCFSIDQLSGWTKPNGTGKTKLLFPEFINITNVKSITWTLPD